MKMEAGQEIGEKPYRTNISVRVKDFSTTWNFSFNDNEVKKIAEEKFSYLSKEELAARCTQVKKIEEYLKLEPATDEMSE
jgi:hypothetical protein